MHLCFGNGCKRRFAAFSNFKPGLKLRYAQRVGITSVFPQGDFRQKLEAFYGEAFAFLNARAAENHGTSGWHSGQSISSFWSQEAKERSLEFAKQARTIMAEVANFVEKAFLISPTDRRALRIYTGKMDAVVRGWRYEFAEKSYEEGFGFTAEQDFEVPVHDGRSLPKQLSEAYAGVLRILDLVAPHPPNREVAHANAPAYRKDTAFVMMRISKDMDDTLDTVLDVFKSFGIVAKRADQMQHEGVITQRILEELGASEFLFADLTGERPSVYYEIGYAHALGKRVILYRKQGTFMHFDLLVHNCPEYSSLRELREKLTARLKAVTGREHVGNLAD